MREGLGRWGLPTAIAYFLWRNSFLFPSLGAFTSLVTILLVLEATGFSRQPKRRALHDRLARTYTIDATKPFTHPHRDSNHRQSPLSEPDEEAAIASIVITPEEPSLENPKVWQFYQQNPSQTLISVALLSMSAVLAILVGTQIYIQAQQNQRVAEQRNTQQFLTLIKQLTPNSTATKDERQKAILAMGTLNDPQATQYLVNLLSKETNPILVETIQQALVSIGSNAMPDLKRMNQYLSTELEPARGSKALPPEVLQKQLQANQRVMNKILAVYNGQANGLDLSNINLGQNASEQSSFNLVLDKIDLWGIRFKSANLSFGSFKGSRFRGGSLGYL